jgi:hypothetical protein
MPYGRLAVKEGSEKSLDSRLWTGHSLAVRERGVVMAESLLALCFGTFTIERPFD